VGDEVRSFLKKEIIIKREVSTNYEIASILSENKNKTVFFENVKGYKNFRIVGNLCPTRERVCEALGTTKQEFIYTVLEALKNLKDPTIVQKAKFKEKKVSSLKELPILKHFREDAGRYITSGVVIARDPKYGRNASIHRLLVLNENKMAIRLCERDLYRYFRRASRNGKGLEIAIAIGVHPAILFSAAFSYSIYLDELKLATSLLGGLELAECETVDLEVPKESEIVIEGKILPNEEAWEGPFMDITGTYDIRRKQPVIEVTNIMHRRDAIYHALLPAGEEHKLLMGMPQEPRIFESVQRIAEVKNVCLTRGGCNWLHGVISIKKNSPGEAKNVILSALAAHPSMKHVIVVDDDIDIFNPVEVEYAIATRFQGDRDLIIIKGAKGSSLDPSSKKGGVTTKLGIDATRKE